MWRPLEKDAVKMMLDSLKLQGVISGLTAACTEILDLLCIWGMCVCVYVRESRVLSDERLRTSHTWLGIGKSTVIPEVKKSMAIPEVKKKFHNFLSFHSNTGVY